MAGWLGVWTCDGVRPDAHRWALSIRAAVRYGGAITEQHGEQFSLGAWRRQAGEFPQSGVISASAGTQVAWVGQCVDDTGDTSTQAMSLVAADAFNESTVAALNGPFAALMFRAQPFEARIVTDRYRHYPVYVFKGRNVVVASTEMRCVLPWLEQVTLNRDAVNMLLRCGELIDRMTLINGIELLPPGTVLCERDGKCTERRYWSLRHDGSNAGSLEATAENLSERISVAVRRLQAVSPRLGVTLSGGLDSRLILDLCSDTANVPSFTCGLPGCRDILCATQFANLIGSPHTVKHWEPEKFPPLWARGVDLTAGAIGVDHMYMLPFVGLLGTACDVVLNGLAGDAILGGNFLKYSWLKETDIHRLGRASWRWRVSEGMDALADRLMGVEKRESASSEQWAASVAARPGARPVERLNDWLYENRVFRTTNSGTMLMRSGVESHAPFFDRDFIDAVLKVRQEHKFKHRLYLRVMKQATPRAASVTWQRTNVAPGRGYYANLAAMAVQGVLGKVSAPLGIDLFKSLKVADPAAWFRGPWQASAANIVISDRALQRGLFDPAVVRSLWDEHLAGRNWSRQLSVLTAIELFARQMIDGAEPGDEPA